MTMAVCFHCGAMKHGAFNLCPQCRTQPDSEDHLAKSLAMTDHNFSAETLELFGRDIREGRPPDFDPQLLASMRGDRSLRMIRRVRSHFLKSRPPPPNDELPAPDPTGDRRDANPEPDERLSDAESKDKPTAPPSPETGSTALGVGCGLLVLAGVIRIVWGMIRDGAK